MRKNFNKALFAATAFVVLALATLMSACSTLEDTPGGAIDGTVSVSVSVLGISEAPSDTRVQAVAKTEAMSDPMGELFMDVTAEPYLRGASARATTALPGTSNYTVLFLDGSSKVAAIFTGTGGSNPTPVQQVPVGTYTVVAFSFNDNSTLPTFTVGSAPGSITSAVGKDLLYYKTLYTLNATNGTPVSIPLTFSHKLAQITSVKVNSHAMMRQVNSVTATIGTFDATLDLAAGTVGKGSAGTISLTIATGGNVVTSSTPSSSSPIFVNPAGTYSINYTSLKLGTDNNINTTYSNKTATFSALTEGHTYTVTSRVSRCGAKVDASTTKLFMCYNLGVAAPSDANYVDPFTLPNYQINGGYWQWGNLSNSVDAPTDASASEPAYTWSSTNYNSSVSAWNSGTDSAPIKTTNDPCPAGYRIPTFAEWLGVGTSNTKIKVPATWSDYSSSNTSFSNGLNFGGNLLLPAAGNRKADGQLENRGASGSYWSSKQRDSSYNYYLVLRYDIAVATIALPHLGQSIRCIAE